MLVYARPRSGGGVGGVVVEGGCGWVSSAERRPYEAWWYGGWEGALLRLMGEVAKRVGV
jgi:hypothetical protein